jgi:hypothetical protein
LAPVQTFPIRSGRWARILLAPLAPRRPTVTVDESMVSVRMGLAGRADIPVARIDRVGTMVWPKWGGFGARIARNLVAFVGHSGTLVLVELSEPLRVRAPLGWTASSIAIGAEDVEGLISAISEARRPHGVREAPPEDS